MRALTAERITAGMFAAIAIAALVLPVAVSLAVNLYRDPFQIFFRDNPAPTAFIGLKGRDRYQHVGIIRNYQPKSVILGHSLAANFLPTMVERTLGWKAVYSLTMNGAPIYQQRVAAEFALANSKIQNVLWLVSPESLRPVSGELNFNYPPFPSYLYDDSRSNDLAFFAVLPWEISKFENVKRAVHQQILNKNSTRKSPIDPRDRATSWFYLRKNKFNVPDKVAELILGAPADANYSRLQANEQLQIVYQTGDIARLRPRGFDQTRAWLHQNIGTVIEQNPQTRFDLVLLPPLPLLYWQQMKGSQPVNYKKQLAYIRAATEFLSKYPNVRIFGFAQAGFTADLRLYKDETHYHIAVNDYILSEISRNRGRLTATNVSEYLAEFDRQVSNYRIPPHWQPEVKSKPGKLSMAAARNIINSSPSPETYCDSC